MALPITVPYTFGNATTAIPLSNLDSDYATVYQAVNGIGNGSVALANVAITGGTISGNTTASNVTVSSGTFTNVTLSNVTISSVSTPITAAEGGTGSSSAFTTNGVVYASSTSALATGSALTFDGTNLGIGTTSPAAKLDVIANSTYQLHLATTTGNYSSAGIYLGALGTSDPGYYGFLSYDQPSETTRIGARTSSQIGGIAFYTAGASTPVERARIDYSGNLLVGATASGQPDANYFMARNASGFQANIGHATGTASGQPFVYMVYGGVAIGSITQSGTTAVLYNLTSDQRLKENIANAESSSDLIDAIQVRQYNWKSDGSFQRYGFIAQELVTVAPEAVHQPADPEEMMAVDYSKLVPMLVKEIQSLRKRILTLENK